jgi:hypothetical protein
MGKLKLVTHLRTLNDRLAGRRYPGLKLNMRLIPEGRHITLFPNAVSLGLVDAFGL